MTLAERLAKLFSINLAAKDAEDALVAEAEKSIEMAGKLKDILTAAGFGNVAELVKSVPELVKARERLSSMTTELDTALKALAGFQDMERDAEVSAVMSVHAMPEITRSALLLSLKTDAVAFRTNYPLPDDKRKHLLSTFAAGKGGTQVETPKTGDRLSISERTKDGAEIDLRGYTGNIAQRVIAHLSSKDPTFAKLSWHDQVRRASEFRQANEARIAL